MPIFNNIERPKRKSFLREIAEDVLEHVPLKSSDEIIARGRSKSAIIDVPYLIARWRRYEKRRPLRELIKEVKLLEIKKDQLSEIEKLERKKRSLELELAKIQNR